MSTSKYHIRSDYRREEIDVMTTGRPLDLSFKNAAAMDELVRQRATTSRLGKLPDKTCNDRFFTSSLWLSNNALTSISKIDKVAKAFLECPDDLRWLDLAYNQITGINDDLLRFKNLTILYLHGNKISDIKHVLKLRGLPNLRSLTLHGNPIEQMPYYRRYVVAILPQICNLDFSPVIETEKKRPLPTGFFKTIQVNV